MRAFHNTRSSEYRTPYGALRLGGKVTLSLDVDEVAGCSVTCRTWTDGKGEELVEMDFRETDKGFRFTCALTPEEPAILWYSFIIRCPDAVYRYGAKEGSVGGEGAVYLSEPPSFQITVYRERAVPEWFKGGIVYQIFPDSFRRGADWQKRAAESLNRKRSGPGRALRADWHSPPHYEKDQEGRVSRWDFYAGTLSGVREKLAYLKEMGVSALYLNPIFEAASNHRYDIGDFLKLDPLLGGPGEFELLCSEAAAQGISVILDGVFNHTGCDSLYFNKYGNYPGPGAFRSQGSVYRNWYKFNDGGYESWWGVDDLPEVDENEPSYRSFIYGDESSVVRRWLKSGARGWRLDVADELPDDFIAGIKSAALKTRPDSVLIGEVWEDASNKISYGKLRRYLLGEELDSVMNYPLRDAMVSFILGRTGAAGLCETVESLKENYPPEAFLSALNLMGSHDRPRILTALGGAPEERGLTDIQRAEYRLSSRQRTIAKGRLWLATLCQMTLPGVPCIYYGDEAGMEGYADPYNRASFPWGDEDPDTKEIYRNAISLRRIFKDLLSSDCVTFCRGEDVFGFSRSKDGESISVLINRSESLTANVQIPALGDRASELAGARRMSVSRGTVSIALEPLGSAFVYFSGRRGLGKSPERGSGVLCHITSLPGGEERGNIGEPARRFIRFLANTKQSYWQILPLHPADEYGSPYAGVSAFAADPSLIDTGGRTLEEMFAQFAPESEYLDFCLENDGWLTPYSVFMAISDRNAGARWQEWPEEYRKYTPELAARETLKDGAAFHKFCQYEFMRQWREMREYAHEHGIMIIGDMPMYVAESSSDTWAEPELFSLDSAGYAVLCAGVPPDYFAEDGQLWGSPVYNWENIRAGDHEWWLSRLARTFKLYDYVRLDHFRGFEAYWAVPAGERASAGRWLPGPGAELFEKAEKRFGPLPVIAEDLGHITPGVRALIARCGFPGIDVLQFCDSDPRQGYYPLERKIAYTGTHDNRPLLGWCADRYPEEDSNAVASELMMRVMRSPAEVAILPLADVLGLGDEARMNTPGTTEGNWRWRASWRDFFGASKRLLNMTELSKRDRGANLEK